MSFFLRKASLKGLKMKKISVLLISLFVFILCSTISYGFWGIGEKEVNDPYLVGLFTPNFPYKSVKIVQVSPRTRCIVIKAKEKITEEVGRKYNDLLLSRGVDIYGTFYYGFFSWQKSVTDYAITITRKVKGEPDTIEMSTSTVRNSKGEPIVAVSISGKEIRIQVENYFGKIWHKVVIVPKKEIKAPDSKIGRYPGSKLIYAENWPYKGRTLRYVSKDSLKDISLYFYKKAKEIYEDAGPDPLKDPIFTSNPDYLTDITPFGIKCMGKFIYINASIAKEKPLPFINIRLTKSMDANLSQYVQIEIDED